MSKELIKKAEDWREKSELLLRLAKTTFISENLRDALVTAVAKMQVDIEYLAKEIENGK